MKLAIGKGVLFPHDDEARDFLAKHRPSDIVEIEMLSARSIKFNAWVFGVVDRLAKMLGVTFDEMRAELLVETGRASSLQLRTDGKWVTVLPSMSRASMTQRELSSFWDDAKQYILDKVMISLDVPDQNIIREMLGESDGQSDQAEGGRGGTALASAGVSGAGSQQEDEPAAGRTSHQDHGGNRR